MLQTEYTNKLEALSDIFIEEQVESRWTSKKVSPEMLLKLISKEDIKRSIGLLYYIEHLLGQKKVL